MMKGFSITNANGIGDHVQFSSLPENYFRHTGEKLVDVSRSWVFDHNPYVVRDVEPSETIELWNVRKRFKRTPVALSDDAEAPAVFQSNAEHHAAIFDVPVVLNRPRLYHNEDFPFYLRELILFQPVGRAQGVMPDHVVKHIIEKYGDLNLWQIGLPGEPDYGIPKLVTPSIWDLVRVISQSRMVIGMDSGPAWIAACFPDVVVKKLRAREDLEYLKTWIPLDMGNYHSQWDDRIFQIFNPSGDDVGFTSSFKKI